MGYYITNSYIIGYYAISSYITSYYIITKCYAILKLLLILRRRF
jgi:hypothetical protein